jgi:toxin-antitoxin system PIN domain toxin
MRYLLADVNVWLATVVDEHPHHDAAADWWKNKVVSEPVRVAFCRMTQLGLLRLLTNVRVMGEQRKTIADAWTLCQRLLSQPQIVFAPEPEGTEEHLARHCLLGGSSRKFWTDGYLAAFAKAGDLRLASFDQGFKRYPDLDLELLRPSAPPGT